MKAFRAHLQAISSVSLSANEERYASCCPQEQTIKVFDVLNFDLMNMIKLNFTPMHICFVHKASSFAAILAVSDKETPALRLVRAEQSLVERKSEGAQVVMRLKNDLHEEPISMIKFNKYGNYALSFAGVIPEVWDPETLEVPASIEMMSATDLYELCEMKVVAAEFTAKYLVVLTLDQKLILFHQGSLKLIKVYDESLDQFMQLQGKDDTPDLLKVQASDVERRVSIEKEFLKECTTSYHLPCLSVDETEDLICFGSANGIKCLNLKTDSVTRVLGKSEQ